MASLPLEKYFEKISFSTPSRGRVWTSSQGSAKEEILNRTNHNAAWHGLTYAEGSAGYVLFAVVIDFLSLFKQPCHLLFYSEWEKQE